MTENLVGYHCKTCKKNFYLEEEPKESRKDFVCCPLCKDFVRVEKGAK